MVVDELRFDRRSSGAIGLLQRKGRLDRPPPGRGAGRDRPGIEGRRASYLSTTVDGRDRHPGARGPARSTEGSTTQIPLNSLHHRRLAGILFEVPAGGVCPHTIIGWVGKTVFQGGCRSVAPRSTVQNDAVRDPPIHTRHGQVGASSKPVLPLDTGRGQLLHGRPGRVAQPKTSPRSVAMRATGIDVATSATTDPGSGFRPHVQYAPG